MKLRVVLAGTLLAGSSLQAQANLDVRLRGHENPVRLDSVAVWSLVPATPAQTYAAAVAVLESIQMPATTKDSLRGLLHMPPFNTSRKIMGNRMSWALNCGDGFSGPNADSYRVHMSYALFLLPTVDGKTRLGVALAAGANNVDGAFRSATACGSTGALENELAMLIRARVQIRP